MRPHLANAHLGPLLLNVLFAALCIRDRARADYAHRFRVSLAAGFVSFTTPDHAQLAIAQMNGFVLLGKKLDVRLKGEWAAPRRIRIRIPINPCASLRLAGVS